MEMDLFFEKVWEIFVYAFLENAQITMPLIVSIVAIIISVSTAAKQNNIALFELRYRCYSQLRTIYAFDCAIRSCNDSDSDLILKMFDALWGANVANLSGDDIAIAARCQLELIARDVLQQTFLFRHKFKTDFRDIVTNVQHIVIDATSGKVNMEEQDKLHCLCDQFEKKDLCYMRRKLKI